MIEERKIQWEKAKKKIDLDEVETALIEKYGEIGKEEPSESEILKMIEQQKLTTSFPTSAEDYAIWISGRLTDEEVRHWGSLITACLCCCVEDEEMSELYEEAEEFRNYLESQSERALMDWCRMLPQDPVARKEWLKEKPEIYFPNL